MVDIIHWPAGMLTPQASPFDPQPISRSGGRSLGGISRSVRTDRGFWQGSLKNIVFRRAKQSAQVRTWNAIRSALAGTSGLVVVPVALMIRVSSSRTSIFFLGICPSFVDKKSPARSGAK